MIVVFLASALFGNQQFVEYVFDMEEKHAPALPETKNQSPEVALDTLNAELRAKRNKSVSSRRLMEASIESKARKRRKSEGPSSSLLRSKSPG